jgi:hypothetical protein
LVDTLVEADFWSAELADFISCTEAGIETIAAIARLEHKEGSDDANQRCVG